MDCLSDNQWIQHFLPSNHFTVFNNNIHEEINDYIDDLSFIRDLLQKLHKIKETKNLAKIFKIEQKLKNSRKSIKNLYNELNNSLIIAK